MIGQTCAEFVRPIPKSKGKIKDNCEEESSKLREILLVELRELIQVVVADAVAAFDRVELLSASAEVEALWISC